MADMPATVIDLSTSTFTDTVTKTCSVCGEPSMVVVDTEALHRWHKGEYWQDILPNATPDQREALISGTHPACWDKMFAGDGPRNVFQ